MHQRVAKLPALVDRSGRLRGDVAGNAPGEGELLEQPSHSALVAGHARIELAISPFQVGIGHQARTAVPRPGDKDHIQVVLLDDPIQMNVDEIQSRRRAPVAKQPRLDV